MSHFLITAGILFSSLFLVGCEDNTPPQQTVTPSDASVVAPTTPNTEENTGTATAPSIPTPPQEGITAEEAKAIAMAHAGVLETEVKFVTTEFEYEKGVPEWEIEFYVGVLEYDYDIHGITGEILSFDQEIEFGKPDMTPSVDTSTNGYLTQDQVKDIILAHAGVSESDISRLEYDFEMEKGVPEYEVEFYVGFAEYDYEINAITGEILSFESDGKNNNTGTTDTAEIITEAEAKVAALQHAGLAESEISRYTSKLVFEDRVYQYEIEFDMGRVEYEYDIDAITGAILSYEQDRD